MKINVGNETLPIIKCKYSAASWIVSDVKLTNSIDHSLHGRRKVLRFWRNINVTRILALVNVDM